MHLFNYYRRVDFRNAVHVYHKLSGGEQKWDSGKEHIWWNIKHKVAVLYGVLQVRNILNRVRFVVVPIVNPDGYVVSYVNSFLRKDYFFGDSLLGLRIVCGGKTERTAVHIWNFQITKWEIVLELIWIGTSAFDGEISG